MREVRILYRVIPYPGMQYPVIRYPETRAAAKMQRTRSFPAHSQVTEPGSPLIQMIAETVMCKIQTPMDEGNTDNGKI